jgi:hypothetical protein
VDWDVVVDVVVAGDVVVAAVVAGDVAVVAAVVAGDVPGTEVEVVWAAHPIENRVTNRKITVAIFLSLFMYILV